jgi:hypothetical protein
LQTGPALEWLLKTLDINAKLVPKKVLNEEKAPEARIMSKAIRGDSRKKRKPPMPLSTPGP